MSKDINKILQRWEFKENSKLVRRFIGSDGREKLQRRIDLGILQLEVEDRPDGIRPHGFPSLFDYYQHLAEAKIKGELKEDPFPLSTEKCEDLQIEALLYYQRRLCFFELHDYTRAARDACRNLEVFEFVRQYALCEEDKAAMDQFRPFVIFHRVKAEVLNCLEKREYDAALQFIEKGEKEIQSFFEEYEQTDLTEESEEIQQLSHWSKQILKLRPMTRKEFLEKRLEKAVEKEEYEKAAKIRDEIQKNLPGEDKI